MDLNMRLYFFSVLSGSDLGDAGSWRRVAPKGWLLAVPMCTDLTYSGIGMALLRTAEHERALLRPTDRGSYNYVYCLSMHGARWGLDSHFWTGRHV